MSTQLRLDLLGSHTNYLSVWDQADAVDRQAGADYYYRQYNRLSARAYLFSQSVHSVVGAFAALSPNIGERVNYLALDRCLLINSGRLPLDSKVPAYGKNKAKALRILRGGFPLDVLRGPKVRAFYHNTMDYRQPGVVTLDGHMLNVWVGQVRPLSSLRIQRRHLEAARQDMLLAASGVGVPAAVFQATLWLTWKRIHRILYSPQFKLWEPEYEDTLLSQEVA